MNHDQYIIQAGFQQPTEMQSAYFRTRNPYSILLANTGSGKTLAYLIRLAGFLSKDESGQALVICPTRELSMQVAGSWSSIRTGIRTVVCYGGHSFKNEAQQLSQGPRVIIGTPGRILDHYRRETPGTERFAHLVIDEYDKTLEMGFLKEIEAIYAHAGKPASIQLVSATEIESLPPIFGPFGFETLNMLDTSAPAISFFSVAAEGHDKLFALVSFLATLKPGPALIFCTHREAAERISRHLQEYGKSNVLFHGGMDQPSRERALVKFRNGSEDLLVCTDLAARGLDIPDISYVIHYQFPQTLQDFTHRNGRTARMKKDGKVYLIHSEEEPLPDYTGSLEIKPLKAPAEIGSFPQPKWTTLYIDAGRKDKIRKSDIAGFFMKEMGCPAEDTGTIDIFDSYSYIALHSKRYRQIREQLHKKKIKKVSVKISLCR